MTTDISKSFAPVAVRYRWHRRITIGASAGFFCCISSIVLPYSSVWLALTLALTFLIVAAASGVSTPKIKCPSCGGDLDSAIDRYCPECGSRRIDYGGIFVGMRCGECRKPLWRGKVRSYKIRACTHCGAKLDDRGL